MIRSRLQSTTNGYTKKSPEGVKRLISGGGRREWVQDIQAKTEDWRSDVGVSGRSAVCPSHSGRRRDGWGKSVAAWTSVHLRWYVTPLSGQNASNRVEETDVIKRVACEQRMLRYMEQWLAVVFIARVFEECEFPARHGDLQTSRDVSASAPFFKRFVALLNIWRGSAIAIGSSHFAGLMLWDRGLIRSKSKGRSLDSVGMRFYSRPATAVGDIGLLEC